MVEPGATFCVMKRLIVVALKSGMTAIRVRPEALPRFSTTTTTSAARPASSSHQRVTAIVRASGALVALGPAARGQVLLAGLFAGELKLKLAKSPGKGWTRHSATLLLAVS